MPIAGETIRLRRGRYRLEALIASSSFGQVWLARRALGVEVALKFVRIDRMQLAAPQDRHRWRDGISREAAFLRGLTRQETRHIVRLLDAGEWEGLPVMAMEKMSGTVESHMLALAAKGVPLDLATAIDWLGQVNDALRVVHSHGFRYLDLKPSNLLLSADGKVLKAADFGTNRPPEDAAGHSFAGTLGWQAPEQFFPDRRDGEQFVYCTDQRSDYFALGMLFHYLVTGGAALRFATDCQETFRQHGQQGSFLARERKLVTLHPLECQRFVSCIDVPVGTHVEVDVNSTWVPRTGAVAGSRLACLCLELLGGLLALSPEDRPQNGADIASALDNIRNAVDESRGSSSSVKRAGETKLSSQGSRQPKLVAQPKARKSGHWMIWLLVALGLTSGGAVALYLPADMRAGIEAEAAKLLGFPDSTAPQVPVQTKRYSRSTPVIELPRMSRQH